MNVALYRLRHMLPEGNLVELLYTYTIFQHESVLYIILRPATLKVHSNIIGFFKHRAYSLYNFLKYFLLL